MFSIGTKIILSWCWKYNLLIYIYLENIIIVENYTYILNDKTFNKIDYEKEKKYFDVPNYLSLVGFTKSAVKLKFEY